MGVLNPPGQAAFSLLLMIILYSGCETEEGVRQSADGHGRRVRPSSQ